jgi:hypothetical protein
VSPELEVRDSLRVLTSSGWILSFNTNESPSDFLLSSLPYEEKGVLVSLNTPSLELLSSHCAYGPILQYGKKSVFYRCTNRSYFQCVKVLFYLHYHVKVIF